MNKTIVLSLALITLFLAPVIVVASQAGRFERLRERAEFRREMREGLRERSRARAEAARTRLHSELRWRAHDSYWGPRERHFDEYRAAVRQAMRDTRRALRDALRDRW